MHDAPIASLANYDRMVTAIEQCYRVDEVKELRDKAIALESYARQAQNIEAERKAIEIRIRAERQAGLLLKEMERGTPNPGKVNQHIEVPLQADREPSEYQREKQQANISDTQAHRWQRLAEIPRVDFENKLQDPLIKPTTTGLISANTPKQAPDDALALWGWLKDFEKNVNFHTNVNEIVGKLSDAVQSDVRRIAPAVVEWLGDMTEEPRGRNITQ